MKDKKNNFLKSEDKRTEVRQDIERYRIYSGSFNNNQDHLIFNESYSPEIINNDSDQNFELNDNDQQKLTTFEKQSLQNTIMVEDLPINEIKNDTSQSLSFDDKKAPI